MIGTTVKKMDKAMLMEVSRILRKEESKRLQHWIGIETCDGRKVYNYKINTIEIEIPTGDVIGFIENYKGEIEILKVKRENILGTANNPIR